MPIVILGGVTAVGKTSTAKKLKELHNWVYIEGDEHHSSANIEKMAAGMPLTDEDRLPWLQTLHKIIKEYSSTNRSCVITCSALKRVYRQILLTGTNDLDVKVNLPGAQIYIIILTISKKTLTDRLLQRQHTHFMNPILLDSQLKILELPKSSTDEPYVHIIKCDDLSADEVIEQIEKIIKS